jgi:hypothetical protein
MILKINSKKFGVYWNNILKYWVAEVRCDRKRVYCGYFKDEISAAKARDEVAKLHHKEFVRLNFPEAGNA